MSTRVGLASPTSVSVTGTISATPVGTQDVRVVNVLSATNITIASIATGSVSIINTPVITATVSVLPAISGSVSVINTPVVTASQGGTWNIATLTTLLGVVAISGTATALPSGTQDVQITNILSATNITIASITTGTISTVFVKTTGAALTNVVGTAASVTILTSNAGRVYASVFNDGPSPLYLKYGVTASNVSYSVKMYSNDFYEVTPHYFGILTGIWDASTGTARVTEVG